MATSHAALGAAAGKVAAAMAEVGLDRWPRFVADDQERARDPATLAAVEQSRRPPEPGRDAIRPAYPLETMLPGLGAKRAVDLARIFGGAMLRQAFPESRPLTGGTAPSAAGRNATAGKPGEGAPLQLGEGKSNTTNAPSSAGRPPISRQKQDGHIAGTPQNRNRIKLGKPTSTFDGSPAEADALTQEAWQKGTPVPNQPGVRDYNVGRRIGTGGYGGGQSSVRVYQNSAGRIHAHPVGPETP